MLLLLWACTGAPDPGTVDRTPGGGGDGPGPADDSGADDSGATGECGVYGFEEAVAWALPPMPGSGPWRRSSDLLCGDPSEYLYMLEDMNGDAVLDFVAVRDCADADGTGDDHWTVFYGTGAGWEAEAQTWALPEPQQPYGWAKRRSDDCENSSRTRYRLLDVTGDGWTDLVVFDDCQETTQIGQGIWRVHAGGAGGFDVAGATWTATPNTAMGRFARAESTECREDATPRFILFEVDGDGFPDLLLTGDCGAHPGLGTDYWQVVPGTGSGFDFAGTRTLVLPSLGAEMPIAQGYVCSSGSDPVYRFRDIDGDGARELIVSGWCDGRAEPGTTRWDIYPQEASGFGALVELQMPDVGLERAWVRNPETRCGGSFPGAQSLWDVDEDGDLDFVLRELCDGTPVEGLGQDHYRVWLRGADGALSGEKRFALSPDPEGTLWVQMQDDHCGHVGDQIMGINLLDAGRMPETVMTYACEADGPVGWTEWRVGVGGCIDDAR
ncbi:MAG: hypothetical protein VX265_14090 [Myxococcota bacterium]|nr:hypothetical protein [Myxococcota bacterium]MEC8423311.1 hypothetical protein [Myxococcota bacterium]